MKEQTKEMLTQHSLLSQKHVENLIAASDLSGNEILFLGYGLHPVPVNLTINDEHKVLIFETIELFDSDSEKKEIPLKHYEYILSMFRLS